MGYDNGETEAVLHPFLVWSQVMCGPERGGHGAGVYRGHDVSEFRVSG